MLREMASRPRARKAPGKRARTAQGARPTQTTRTAQSGRTAQTTRTADSPPTRRSPVLRDERRAQLVAAAREVFGERGYHAATVDDITRVAGVAKGTFYLYFQEKREIYYDLVR